MKELLFYFSVIFLFSGQSYADFKGINSLLPSKLNKLLQVNLEVRHRFEYKNNFDFNSSEDDEDGYHLLRGRFNIAVKPFKFVKIFTQIQDSRIFENQGNDTPTNRDDFDVRQIFAEVKDLLGGFFYLRVGRQELSYEDQRVLGGFNWSNVAQSFDAVKLGFKFKLLAVDLFAARKVKIRMRSPDRWNDKDNFLGAYLMLKKIPYHKIHFYYFFRDTRSPGVATFGSQRGQMDESTIGLLVKGKGLAGFDYTIEGVYQFGNYGEGHINAFGLVVVGGYTLPFPGKVRLGVEWDLGSGDDDPGDNTRKTFDNLYPTNHLHYGYMDRASLQNLNNVRFQLSSKPADKLYLQCDLHWMNLYTTKDSFYNAGRKAILQPLPEAGNNAGVELDLLLKYKFNNFVNVLVGYSHFFPGEFLKKSSVPDAGEFFYLQTIIKL